jgi:hypothetical protein
MPAARVFISYSSADRLEAEKLERVVSTRFEVWRDKNRLESDWSREIANALAETRAHDVDVRVTVEGLLHVGYGSGSLQCTSEDQESGAYGRLTRCLLSHLPFFAPGDIPEVERRSACAWAAEFRPGSKRCSDDEKAVKSIWLGATWESLVREGNPDLTRSTVCLRG